MQPIQAVIAAWPFATSKLDPVVFFRESPLRFQGVMGCDELLQLLQRGAFTVIEYVVPLASGSCVPRLSIRYSATTGGEQFTVTAIDHGREETLRCFRPSHRIELATWLEQRIESHVAVGGPSGVDAPRIEAAPQFVRPPAPVAAKLFIVAYARAGERRRAGHSVRAAFAYRKAHPEVRFARASGSGTVAARETAQADPRMSAPIEPGDLPHAISNPESDRDHRC